MNGFRFLASTRAFTMAAILSAVVMPTSLLQADSGTLEGAWSGNGKIIFPSGEIENARCKANFKRNTGDSFGMSAICATASTRVVQNAQVARTVGNRFAGEFNNPDYGITGRIQITLRGSTMSAALEGGGGKAEFNLSK